MICCFNELDETQCLCYNEVLTWLSRQPRMLFCGLLNDIIKYRFIKRYIDYNWEMENELKYKIQVYKNKFWFKIIWKKSENDWFDVFWIILKCSAYLEKNKPVRILYNSLYCWLWYVSLWFWTDSNHLIAITNSKMY